mmetsp:Transcript_36527/g.97589  ORF Transcript_36527/g.97589 Transcript_36527/m.97589 type:complete len:318 (+) Transcript_36527:79-1032(+)
MCEVLKWTISCFMCINEDKSDIGFMTKFRMFQSKIMGDPKDFAKLAIPSALYTIQNNLAYYAVSNLPAATYQLLYQAKILTTAMFSVFLLGRKLSQWQWISLVFLVAGVGMVQTSSMKASSTESADGQNELLGFFSVLAACCSSGLAGVYFEMVLKGSKVSLWVKNVQMSTIGIMLGLLPVYKDREQVMEKGFFFGYNNVVITVVLLQAAGGLLVALVVKYADNIQKGFATSISILISGVVSYFMFNLVVNQQWLMGACCVFYAVYLYSSNPLQASNKPQANSNGKTNGKGNGDGAGGETIRSREKSAESSNTQHDK